MWADNPPRLNNSFNSGKRLSVAKNGGNRASAIRRLSLFDQKGSDERDLVNPSFDDYDPKEGEEYRFEKFSYF